jgi:GNAT superfamily N-acetyltransferase
MPNPISAIHVRDASPDDESTIVRFNLELARETEGKRLDPDTLVAGVAAALAEPERLRYWIAEIDGAIVGQAAVSREWSDWRNGWIWWFQSVFVAAEARGLGVFRALHTRIRDEALTLPDVIGLRLYVEHQNDRAIRTYKTLGMVPGGYQVYEELWLDRLSDDQAES